MANPVCQSDLSDKKKRQGLTPDVKGWGIGRLNEWSAFTSAKEMLDQSARELRITVEELEKRYEAIESEDPDLTARGNEWKTRFETQEEMNQQLERQIIMLQDKIEEAKRNLKDAKNYVAGRTNSPPDTRTGTPKSKSTGITINISVSPQAGKTPRDMKSFDDLSDYIHHLKRILDIEAKANPAMVKTMEKEKNMLFNQLRDLEWRLDQESKAYHKANDERKQYVVEINSTKGNIDGNKARQRAAVNLQQREVEEYSRSPRLLGYTERYKMRHHPTPDKELRETKYTSRMANVSSKISQTSRASNDYSNIPEDQRIIDPKKGPIKKTAAVKNLPSLETT
ncbi:coiled-coil domain-containing protein 169-like isoform X15 [Mercenaria mercenaria]|uniref:coiled-coil domain-containing protein 169-like isoform X15 n=1 Tax=Mercenaria mercenaria TaxID=6596 RepID=UPI001E1E1C09|nr:coiled-coil domain-containing protein 169-like isoform X15 [Mercenaria mercenaria]